MEELALKPLEEVPLATDKDFELLKKYDLTWMEWAAQTQKQVVQQGGSNVNGTYTLYTVPSNATLYITSAFINAVGADSTTNYIRKGGSAAGENLILQAQAGSNAISFTMPLRFPPSSIIQFNVSGGHTSAGISGFLVYF